MNATLFLDRVSAKRCGVIIAWKPFASDFQKALAPPGRLPDLVHRQGAD
jgi:hypothetical protein